MHSPPSARLLFPRPLVAHVAPMLLFLLGLALAGALRQPGAGALWRTAPELWIYPLQTVLCGVLLFFFRRDYDLHSLGRPLFTLAVAFLVFLLWIAPQQFLGFAPRRVGFNPDLLLAQPTLYGATLLLRFLRLCLVVPLVEEIFWRAFLLRFLIEERFENVPFGTFSWISFSGVTIAFALSHQLADWPAALVTGALYNLVAYRTRSLFSCILAHAVTNLALGLWIMTTKQWGFW